MHFRHVSAKIKPKNLKQYFDWGRGGPPGPSGYALAHIHTQDFFSVIWINWKFLAKNWIFYHCWSVI